MIGDILGVGIYAHVGEVGAEVGGAIWTAFLAAFVLRPLHRLRLRRAGVEVPRGAGAALYTHKAFRGPFLTFILAFVFMSSGIARVQAASWRWVRCSGWSTGSWRGPMTRWRRSDYG